MAFSAAGETEMVQSSLRIKSESFISATARHVKLSFAHKIRKHLALYSIGWTDSDHKAADADQRGQTDIWTIMMSVIRVRSCYGFAL